ncbi:MAG: hypothetical protein LBQ88_22205 [Treponema sp.]|jgi:hypothetical protein|nr:hypothetical protein [Treponema sp.]
MPYKPVKAKFNALGCRFKKKGQDISISGARGGFAAEVDVLFENSGLVIAVEVKTRLNQNDIDEHFVRFVIVLSGDTVKIVQPSTDWKPRVMVRFI